MALVESLKIKLGMQMPDFTLGDPNGKIYLSGELYGPKGLLVAFTCNHCPYAQAVWPRLVRLAKHIKSSGINTVGINPNIHSGYPEDAPDKMKIKIKEWGISFPYLVDETQEAARAFQAQCTPDLYLFDTKRVLIYHGRLDDNWKDEKKVTKEELKEAVENYTKGKPVSSEQFPSMGCSIKWRE